MISSQKKKIRELENGLQKGTVSRIEEEIESVESELPLG